VVGKLNLGGIGYIFFDSDKRGKALVRGFCIISYVTGGTKN